MPEIKLVSHAITTCLSDGRWASACTKDNLFLFEKCQEKHIDQIFRRQMIIFFFFGYRTFNIYLCKKKSKIKKKSVYGEYTEINF